MKKIPYPKAAPLPAFLIAYSDSDFTNPHEAVRPNAPRDCRRDFTHIGKKYWGFETRRHCATQVLAREQAFAYDHKAHNWLRIGLKKRAKVETIAISTKWYTGNQVRAASVILIDELTGAKRQVLARVPLAPDSEHVFKIPATSATEALVECYYEGGIGRIALFGKETKEQLPQRPNLLEKAEISHVSNQHYGTPDFAVRGRRKETHMVGWESARTGFGEQAVFRLKRPSVIDEIVVDTYLHRLNAPLASHVYGVDATGWDIEKLMKLAPRWGAVFDGRKEVVPDNFQDYMLKQKYLKEKGAKNRERFKIRLFLPKGSPWKPLLPFAPLERDTYHRFPVSRKAGAVTHILYMHYPNGGIHGLKAFGTEKPLKESVRKRKKKSG